MLQMPAPAAIIATPCVIGVISARSGVVNSTTAPSSNINTPTTEAVSRPETKASLPSSNCKTTTTVNADTPSAMIIQTRDIDLIV